MKNEEIIHEVEEICKNHSVEHLFLFGSYAKGTETPTSDMDFFIIGGQNIGDLRDEIDRIKTLKKIDLIQYDSCKNQYLKEDMDLYGKKYINRYKSFCKSLEALEKAKDRDLTDDFVISGTVQKFNLAFDISWKVMKDIIIGYHKVLDFATGSPRETLRIAASVKLIHDDSWMQMLDDRNDLAHDYDGALAEEIVHKILEQYLPVLEIFRDTAGTYVEKIG